jgi:hypothetical protein
MGLLADDTNTDEKYNVEKEASTYNKDNAKEAQVEEVILHRDNIVTEGATSLCVSAPRVICK